MAGLMGAGVLALAGCAGSDVYKPTSTDNPAGYSEMQLATNRYQVTFTGDRTTRRDRVEALMLRRAAEVTLAAGYSHFVFAGRNTEAKTYYQTHYYKPEPGAGLDLGAGIEFAHHFRNTPVTSYPMAPETVLVKSYLAKSEIVLLRADQAQGNPNAISARDVLDRIGTSAASANAPAVRPQT